MARRTQTYAIRLAVEGGGQVKAELVSVGQSGDQKAAVIDASTPGACACMVATTVAAAADWSGVTITRGWRAP